jgi:hypothetical protein
MNMGLGGYGSVGGFGGGYGMPFGMGGFGGGYGGFGGFGGGMGGYGGFGGFGSPYVGNQGSPFGGFGSPFGSPMFGGFGGGMGGYGGQFGGLGSLFGGGMGRYGSGDPFGLTEKPFAPSNGWGGTQPPPGMKLNPDYNPGRAMQTDYRPDDVTRQMFIRDEGANQGTMPPAYRGGDPFGLTERPQLAPQPMPNPVTGVMPSEPLPDPNAGKVKNPYYYDRFANGAVGTADLKFTDEQYISPEQLENFNKYGNPYGNQGGAYIPDETGQYDPNRGGFSPPMTVQPEPVPMSPPSSPMIAPRRSPLFQGLASLGQFGGRSPYGRYAQS